MTLADRVGAALLPHVESGALAGAVALMSRGDEVSVACVGVRDRASDQPMTRDTLFRMASVTKPMAAVVAMTFVEDLTIDLDAPVDRWLPELAAPMVLRAVDGPLDDVVPAVRPITLRQLLTFTHGYGAVMAPPGAWPIQERIDALGLGPGPDPSPLPPDEWLARLGTLPLMHQPGEGWTYHGGGDILGVLLARLGGRDLEQVLRERLFDPLGMSDTSFAVNDPARLAQTYVPEGGGLVVREEPPGRWSPPLRASGATGLVSTVDDCLAFGRMLLDGGGTVLRPDSVEQLTTDQLTDQQKAGAIWLPGFWDGWGWGFGGAVATGRDVPGPSAGSYGWTGGLGTAFYVNRATRSIDVLLTQRAMGSPDPDTYADDFWAVATG